MISHRPDGEKSYLLRKNLAYTIAPLAGALAVIALAATQGWLSPDDNINRWIVLFMFILPGTAYTAVLMGYIQARKRIHLMAYAQTLVRISGAVLIVAATYMYGFRGFVITSIVIATVAVGPLLSLVKIDMKNLVTVARPFAQSFRYAKWSTANNTVGTITSFLDIFFLNFMVSDRTEFGYYGIATIFVVGMNSVTTTIQNIAMPYFSEKSGDEIEFRRVLRKYQRQLAVLSASVAAIAIVIVPEVIRIIYGESYSNAGIYFRILALKYFFWSCSTLYGVAIWGMGKMEYIFYYLIVSLAVSVALLYGLITAWGIVGAAWAQAISYAFLFVLVYITARHTVKKHFEELRAKVSTSTEASR